MFVVSKARRWNAVSCETLLNFNTDFSILMFQEVIELTNALQKITGKELHKRG